MRRTVYLFTALLMLCAVMCAAVSADSFVFDFSDLNEIKQWVPNGYVLLDPDTGSMPQLQDPDGTVFMRATTTSAHFPNYLRTMLADDVNLDDYPYFVFKYRKNFSAANFIYISSEYYDEHVEEQYSWYDGQIFELPFQGDNQWHLLIQDMDEYCDAHTNTSMKGEDKSSAAPNTHGRPHWGSKLKSIFVQPSENITDMCVDYEFIALCSSVKDAYDVAAQYAQKRVSENFELDALQMSSQDDYKAAITQRIEDIAAGYEMTVKNVALTTDTQSSSGEYMLEFTYTLNGAGRYDIDCTGTALVKNYGAVVTVDNQTVEVGESVTFSAEVPGLDSVTSLTWYSNSIASESGASALEQTGDSFTVQMLKVGTVFYYVSATGKSGGEDKTVRSDFKQITVKAPDDPIIFRFNNDEIAQRWSRYPKLNTKQYSKNKSTIVDGVMHTEFDTAAPVDDHDIYLQDDEKFYLQAYPYIKYKYKFNGGARSMQFYINDNDVASGAKYIPLPFSADNTDTWTTVSLNAKNGTVFANNQPYEDLVGHMRFWFWMTGAAGYSDIEYIAFFPDSDEGRKAWEDFDSKNPTATGSSDQYLPGYSTLDEIAGKIKEALINPFDSISDSQQARAKMEEIVNTAVGDAAVDSVSIEYDGDVEEGFNFKVTLTIGEGMHCTAYNGSFVLKNKYPEPVIWRFNSPEFMERWSCPGDVLLTLNDEGYANASMEDPVDNCNITYADIPEAEYVDLDEYPIISIRYRNNHPGYIQLYPVTTTSQNTSATGQFYYQKSMPNPVNQWTTLTWNVLTESDVHNSAQGTWNDKLKRLRVDFMRSDNVLKGVDIEYIGFFVSKEQAAAYNGEPAGDQSLVDGVVEGLDLDAFNKVYDGVDDEESARAKLDELLDIELPEGVRTYLELTGYKETDPDVEDGKVGEYGFKIYFLHGPVNCAACAMISGVLPLQPKANFYPMTAQARKDAPEGPRFGTKLFKNFTLDKDVSNVTYGNVVIPTLLIPKGEKLTLETEGAADVPGEKIFSEDDESLIYTTVVTGIPEEMKSVKLSVRAYVKYTFAGKEYVSYSDFIKSFSAEDVKNSVNDGYENEPDVVGYKPYDCETWTLPLWEGDTVYYELFWPVMEEDAAETDDLVVNLLYPISEVLSVKNGTHTVDYAEGKDFTVNEKGQLVIPYGSAIRRTPFNMYVSDTTDSLHTMVVGNRDNPLYSKYIGKYLYYTEGTGIQENFQYSITYRHTAEWTGPNPDDDYEPDMFPITRAKLENKESFTIGYFGDSITAGGNNTGNYNTKPDTPKWREIIAERLMQLYGYTDTTISVVSRAEGGRNTDWGANGLSSATTGSYAKNVFAGTDPTLFILAFGMNDEGTGPARFKSNIISIIEQIHEIYPECEFLLVSNSMPNPLWSSFANRDTYEDILQEVVQELGTRSDDPLTIDCANLQSMHKYCMSLTQFRDFTGNNVNHQNDLLTRLYAQTILAYITDKN